MRFIPQFFHFLKKSIPLIRWILLILFIVACGLLIWFYPQQGEHVDYLSIDKFIVILQIAKGQLSNIYGYDNWCFQFARLILPICLAWAIIEVVVVASLRYLTELAINWWFSDHVIVFGIGEKGFSLAKKLLEKGEHTVVAIDKDAANPYLAQIGRGNGFTLVGDATDMNFLKTLGLHRAAAFYAMTGDDTVNIESAIRLKEYFQKYKISFWNRSWKSLCGNKNETFAARIQVHDAILRRLAWEAKGPFSHASINNHTETSWECYPFSVYDQAAKNIVEEFSPDIAKGKTKKYHVVIVGFGWFGERVALQVIRMCQTPKSLDEELVIHIIDTKADLNRERFYQRYPAVNPDNTGDERYGGYAPLAKLDFIQGDIQRMDEKAIKKAVPDIDESTVIYVCLANELLGSEAAMSLAKITQENGTRIVLALPETERLSEEMKDAFDKYHINMFFPLSSSCLLLCKENHLGEVLDNMGKAVLRAYYGSPSISELEKSWAEEPEWGRESNRQSASHVFFKLRLVGVDPEHIATISEKEILTRCRPCLELLAEAEHDRWVIERLLDGWTYGQRNNDKRLHPSIQSFVALEEKIRDIDRDINSILPNVVKIWQEARK